MRGCGPWAALVLLLSCLQPAAALTQGTAQQPTERALGTAAAARDTLNRYSAALSALDANAVKKVQPSADVESLRRAFKEMRALSVTISSVRVLSADGPIVRVGCKVTQTLTPKAGSKQTTAVTRVVRVRRQEPAWVIDGFER